MDDAAVADAFKTYGGAVVALVDPAVSLDLVLQSYRSDGTVLSAVSVGTDFNDMALSPDGQFVTLLLYDDQFDQVLKVYRMADGALVASRTFSADIL